MASPGDDSDQAIWKPSPPSPDSWKTWTYAEWNERLLEYCLARHDGADGTPVTRIAATPEELTLVVGDDSAAPEAVAERFVEAIRQELPPGRSFSGYCRDYVSYARQSKNPWTPESRDSPHFFAMLWFTCLVAYGYPDASEGFHNRITYLIFSKHDQLTQLPKIWGVDRISDEAAVLGEALSILACNKSGVPLREIHDHVGRLTGTDSLHTLRQQIVRGWAESGAIDLLQQQDGRRTVVVARKPRFVVFRRGPTYLGTLLGLLPQSLEGELERVAKRLGVNLSWQRPANRLQPFAARISDTSGEDIRELSKALGYEDFELLDWSDSSKLPGHLQVKGDLRQDAPPDVYEREAQWCTIHLAFRRIPKDPGEIVVERRGHGKRAPIYVVLDRGNPIGWSYSRTWALLNASERGKQPPFKLTNDGILRTRGRSPLHLPLPLARLCAVVGMGLPGPELEKQGSHIDVKAYVYPFGPRLGQLVKAVIPSSWVRR